MARQKGRLNNHGIRRVAEKQDAAAQNAFSKLVKRWNKKGAGANLRVNKNAPSMQEHHFNPPGRK